MKTSKNLPSKKTSKSLPKNYHSNIKKLRKDRNIKVKDLLKYLGENNMSTSEKSYRDYENDKTMPPIALSYFLADLYGVSIDYLLGRSDFTKDGNEYISSVTGLSDKAINKMRIIVSQSKTLAESNEKNLKRIADKNDNCSVQPILLPLHIDTINFLLESRLFNNLISRLENFFDSNRFTNILDSNFKKLDTDSVFLADKNNIAGSSEIMIDEDASKALTKNLLDIQLNKYYDEYQRRKSKK